MTEIVFHKLISKEPYYTSLSFTLFPVAIYQAEILIEKDYALAYTEFIQLINDSLDEFWNKANLYSQSNISFTDLKLYKTLPFGSLNISLSELDNSYKSASHLPVFDANVDSKDLFKVLLLQSGLDRDIELDNIKLDRDTQTVIITKPENIPKRPYFYVYLFVDIGKNYTDLVPITLLSGKTYKEAKSDEFITVLKPFFERLL